MSTRSRDDEENLDLEQRLRRAQPEPDPAARARVRNRVAAHIARHPGRRAWPSRALLVAAVAIPVGAATAAALLLTASLRHTPPVRLPAAASSPSPTASPATADCDLPVGSAPLGAFPGPSGFLHYPGLQVSPAPRSQTEPVGSGQWRSQSNHDLVGDSAQPSYDAPLGVWLPVPYRAISPDGRHYAYVMYQAPGTANSQPIHLVDLVGEPGGAVRGTDRILRGGDTFDGPVWLADGIYVVRHLMGTDSSNGLWRLDPQTGAATQVDAAGHDWTMLGNGAAWRGRVSPLDHTAPPVKDPAAAGDTAVRLDLATGTQVDWLYRPGHYVQMVGYDANSDPMLTVTDPATREQELWVMRAPGVGTLKHSFASDTNLQEAHTFAGVTWLYAQRAVYRSTSLEVMEKVADGGLPFAGPCVPAQ